MAEKEKRPETFREYLARKLLPFKTVAADGLEPWDRMNRGANTFRGKNQKKRERRAAAKLDRLAAIRYYRRVLGFDHVPKLKRYPAVIFE